MKTRQGFTLIELLVVIVIIGILATQLIPTVLDAPARARDVARTNTVKNIMTNITGYYADYQALPTETICIDGGDPDGNMVVTSSDNEQLEERIKAVFSNKIPKPPNRSEDQKIKSGDLDSGCYGYVYKPIQQKSTGRQNTAYFVATPVERFPTANVNCEYLDAITAVEEVNCTGDASGDDCAPDADDDTTWCFIQAGS